MTLRLQCGTPAVVLGARRTNLLARERPVLAGLRSSEAPAAATPAGAPLCTHDRSQDLTRRFGSLTAVDDLSFSVERGEVVGFLGPNGAGKTTTMYILRVPARHECEHPRRGGHDVLRDSMAVRRSIGYLPESVPLYPELRVDEMMRFQGKLHR